MKNKSFSKYYMTSLIFLLMLSAYPLYMGFSVISDMVKNGTVLAENYPKYIIPYTPVSLAIITGLLFMPLILKFAKKLALFAASALSMGVFFVSEMLFESCVIVTTNTKTTLESCQMYMCYVPREEIRTQKAIDVLIGDYSPAFKLHFYIISIVLILSILNCFYGFADVIINKCRKKILPLVLQSVSSVLFLGLCVFACFTAFFRTGELQVSALSATLMTVFFIVFGLTMGIYTGSLLYGKRTLLSITVPAFTASFVTMLMYVGEMFLLSGNLYRFGTGFFFDRIPGIVLAPVDIITIILSGTICALILNAVKDKTVMKGA